MQLTIATLLAILAASTTLAAPVPASELGSHLEARGRPTKPVVSKPKPNTGAGCLGGCVVMKHQRRDLGEVVELEARGRPTPPVVGTPKPKPKPQPHRRRDLENLIELEARGRPTKPVVGRPRPKPKPSTGGGCAGGCVVQRRRRRDLGDAVELETRAVQVKSTATKGGNTKGGGTSGGDKPKDHPRRDLLEIDELN